MKKFGKYAFFGFYGISSLLLLAEWYWADIQFWGYWTPKIIGWTWLINTVLLVAIFWKTDCAKFYGLGLICLVGISILPMATPFFGLYFLAPSMTINKLP